MTNFFEMDRDELTFENVVYEDYFNLYPELDLEATMEHLNKVDEIVVLAHAQTHEGWTLSATFEDCKFLIDTHYHGTSSLFCIEQGSEDTIKMLAFLGCFLPTLRDHWRTNGLPIRQDNWFTRIFGY